MRRSRDDDGNELPEEASSDHDDREATEPEVRRLRLAREIARDMLARDRQTVELNVKVVPIL